MDEGVWGDVKDWGLADHSDGSPEISIDPVCGKQVHEDNAPKTTYAGVVYYFCSKECQKLFEKGPGEYAGQVYRGPSAHIVDVNASSLEELRRVFPVDEDSLNRILKNRPYASWADFKNKNPGFSDPMLSGIRKSGVIISTPNLHRMV